jgi:vitamin B12 transporter
MCGRINFPMNLSLTKTISSFIPTCLMGKIIACSAFIASTFFAVSVSAQEKESDLDPVTVTTSIATEKASQTGRNLFVIKGERFAGLPVHSIDELLRYLPGVEVQARGPMGSQSDIVMRGGTFQQVLVVLDGLRLNDPNTGHFTAYIPIAPSEIDRIEVLKGASSAVYGSDAVGGVIHIITKSFATKEGVAKSDVIAQITGGEYDFFSANVGGYYTDGKTAIAGGFLTNNTSGQPQRGTRGSLYNHTGSFSFSHRFSDRWQLKMRYAIDSRKFSAQNFYTAFLSDTANERITSFWNQLGLDYNSKNNKLSLNVGYKELEDVYAFNTVTTANKNNSKLIQGLLTDKWKLKPGTTIVSGAQFVSKNIKSNDRGDHRIDQAAAFLILNQQFNKFSISPSAREEWNERFGWEFIPQLNLSYRTSNLQLRASGGKTIRDADFTERYNNYNKPFVKSGRIGNPDLESEHSWSYEAGADFFVAKNLKISGTFFQAYHQDLIDYVLTSYNDMPRKVNLAPPGPYSLAKNIVKVNVTGFESELQYSRRVNASNELWATLGITVLNNKSTETAPTIYILSPASFFINFNGQYTIHRFSFGINGLYKQRDAQTAAGVAKVSSDYFIMNLKTEFHAIKNASIFFEAHNLFDRDYADLLGAQMPGQWLMGGIKISLSK